MFSQESERGQPGCAGQHLVNDTRVRVGCPGELWLHKSAPWPAGMDASWLMELQPGHLEVRGFQAAHEEVWKDGIVSSFPDTLIKQHILPPWKATRLGEHGPRS